MPFPTSIFVQSSRFTEVREIGQGACGMVYYAKDNLGRSVAVKEALPSTRNFIDAQSRFARESQILAAIQHPNIVSVYHLEEDLQSHELYLIYEYVSGGSLGAYLDAHGPLDESQATAVAIDICNGLEAIWQEHIVHRDVKPSNM